MSNREIDYGEIISSMGSDKRKKLVNELVDKEAKRLIVENYSKLNIPIPSGIESSKSYEVYEKQARKNIEDKYNTKNNMDAPWFSSIGGSVYPFGAAYNIYNIIS